MSLCKHLVQSFRIKADHDLIADHNGRSGTAVVSTHQFKDCFLIDTYVFHFKFDSPLREEGFSRITRRSSGLAVDHDFFRHSGSW